LLQVPKEDIHIQERRTNTDFMESIVVGLELKLRPRHFTAGTTQGRIVINCVAKMQGGYREEAKVILRPRFEVPPLARDVPVSSAAAVEPKPERGAFNSHCKLKSIII